MGTEKPNGNHPSCTENTMRNSSPSQNVGTEANRKQYPFTMRSIRRPRFAPARMPNAKPSTPLTAQAVAMSASEFTARVAMTSITGALKRSDVPRSPCRRSTNQLA